MLYVFFLLFVSVVQGALVKYRVDDRVQYKEAVAHFKPLHILSDGEFVAQEQPGRRDLRVSKVGHHTKRLVFHPTSRRIIVHGCMELSKLYEIVGHKGLSVKERYYSDDPLAEKAYVITLKDLSMSNYTVYKLYESPDVLWFDFVRKMKASNSEALKVMFANHPVFESGNGVTITIADTGLDVNHCMFRSSKPVFYDHLSGSKIKPLVRRSLYSEHPKIKAYVTVDYDEDKITDQVDEAFGHGTHVAGSAVGSGCGNVTSGARLIFFDIYNNSGHESFLSMPDVITPMMHASYKMGSRIFSNSWGSEEEFYTSYDYEIDKFAFQHPDYLCVFAAGNSGPDLKTIASPGVTKNCLTVGATLNSYDSFFREGVWYPGVKGIDTSSLSHLYTNEENIAYFSSRGPTSDGRIKPDIVGPGMYIVSASAGTSNGFVSMQGTSMINPLIARLASLVIERLTTMGFAHPTSPLVKSIFVACSEPPSGSSQIANLYNDTIRFPRFNNTPLTPNDYGHGLVHMERFFNNEFTFKDRLFLNESLNMTFACVKSQKIVFVMAYLDQPSLPGSIPSLVNNPDMYILHESSEACHVYYPNGRESLDNINNVEKISLVVSKGDRIHVRLVPGALPQDVAFLRSRSLASSKPRSCVQTERRRLQSAEAYVTRLSSAALGIMWACALLILGAVDFMSIDYFLKR